HAALRRSQGADRALSPVRTYFDDRLEVRKHEAPATFTVREVDVLAMAVLADRHARPRAVVAQLDDHAVARLDERVRIFERQSSLGLHANHTALDAVRPTFERRSPREGPAFAPVDAGFGRRDEAG